MEILWRERFFLIPTGDVGGMQKNISGFKSYFFRLGLISIFAVILSWMFTK